MEFLKVSAWSFPPLADSYGQVSPRTEPVIARNALSPLPGVQLGFTLANFRGPEFEQDCKYIDLTQ